MTKARVAIIGASGYAGGDLLRILLDHPNAVVIQATSESSVGHYVHTRHPNLRKRTDLKFISASMVEPCDVLFTALPHGETVKRIAHLATLAPKIVDLSADFRLRDPEDYVRWYDGAHDAPEWLDKFVYGLPEVNRAAIRGADYVSGVGCNATATNLAIYPLFKAGVVDVSRGVIVEVKAGSSEGGASSSPASHHPDRSGAVRSFAPTGHRHTAEVLQVLRGVGAETEVHMSVTSIELVRGVLATAHCFARLELRAAGFDLKDLWKAYRAAYGAEPFVRLVRERTGTYRYPEPKILAGSNLADVGFDYDAASGRIVAIAAIDNLMKGAAGSAVQCMNLMCGWDEEAGLGFPGLHPI
jgi:N-acetyl-gamma-glutamyl-phosphate/LysW-gamma-L-alpha-aminoadipyl-6-phosphate reductase